MREFEVVSPHARLTRTILGGWAALIYFFLFAPIVLLVVFSFNANKYGTFPFTGWTTSWYGQVFSDYQIRDALDTTLRVAFEVTAISTVVGTAAAFPLVRSRLPFRSGVRIAMTLPIMIPGLLIGVSLLVLLTDVFHLQLSPQTAVIGQSVYTTPFVLLLVAARLQGFDPSLERAASDLGANTLRRLRHVVLPLILPAIFAGALFAFTLSLDEFIITLFLIGGHNTLPIYIYTQVKFGITPEVNALATLLLAASLALIAFAFALPVVRAEGPACRARPPGLRLRLDRDPAALAGAADGGLDRRDAAMAVLERRKRRVRLPGNRGVDIGEEVAERLAVALAVPGRVAGETARLLRIRRRVLDDDLPRRVGRTQEHLGRQLLIPREAALRALALEQELVLPAARPRGEDERAGEVVAEPKQERGVVLERAAGERPELRLHLAHVPPRHVLGQIEPVRPEVADHVRRTRSRGVEAPAGGREEHVVAEIAAVDERDVADRSARHVDSHLLDQRIAASVVAGRVHEPSLLRGGDHCPAFARRDRERLFADDVNPVLDCGQRLCGMDVVRRADVEHVDLLTLEQLAQVVVGHTGGKGHGALARPAADGGDLDPDRLQRDRVHARDEPGADDRRAHQRAARNICVSTSMSSRAPSGGVRHGVPSTMHAWKCRSSRENDSS